MNSIKVLFAISLLGAALSLAGCSSSSDEAAANVPGAPSGAQPAAGQKAPAANQGPPTGAQPGAHR